MRLLLDTNILTRLCHPARDENRPTVAWIEAVLESDANAIYIPEIADYEARRGLSHVAIKSGQSTTRRIRRLDLLATTLDYLPLNTAVMQRAAALWAEARHLGYPTSAGKALDGDVILAAQALEIDGVVITENLKHIERFVTAYRWREAPVGV